jgi:hypothetical protein
MSDNQLGPLERKIIFWFGAVIGSFSSTACVVFMALFDLDQHLWPLASCIPSVIGMFMLLLRAPAEKETER